MIAKGVSAKTIFCDYTGLLAPDSVVRANRVFNGNHITIISQEFHSQHAIWLARQYGIGAIGFNTPDLSMKYGLYTQLQKRLARVSAVIDVRTLHYQPKHLGPLIMIGPLSEHDCPVRE